MRCVPFHRPVVTAVAVWLLGACAPEPLGTTPASERCAAPVSLPGSVPFPPNLQKAVASSAIPPRALHRSRKVCNRLVLEPGAFARRHALSAIDWRPWSRETLAEAAALDRPILALTGSSGCEDCAELAVGALARRRVARDINRYFVPVIVDRDERPDVDAHLMLATQVLTGGAGWPAIVMLLADGRPFEAESWGAASAEARPVARMVEDVVRRLALGGGTIVERAELTAEKMLKRASNDTKGDAPDVRTVQDSLRTYVAGSFDRENAAFGPPPLFPRAPLIGFLLTLHRERGDAAALEMAVAVLEGMQRGALADPAGGFFRFAREAQWKNPAREKLLAENAALASVHFDAAAATARADFLATATKTVDFLLRDLALEGGAFAASIDASSTRGDGRPCAACRDERMLADANGLAISALVRAASALGEPHYLEAAVAAAKLLDIRLRDGGFVAHCLNAGGRRCADGYLSDQVFAALAFLDLDEASAPGGGRWLDAARTIAEWMPEKLGHAGTGGFFLSRADTELPLRLKPAFDASVASGNSAAALLYRRLAARTGEEAYARDATAVVEAFAEVLALRPLALPAMVSALSVSAPPQPEPAPAVQP